MVPIAIYGTIDFLSVLEKFKIERKYRAMMNLNTSKEKANEDYLRVNEPIALSNLGHVDHVVMDKTGTITNPSFAISKLYVNGKIYQFNDDTMKNLSKEYNEKYKTSLTKYFGTLDMNIIQSPTLKSNTIEEVGSFSEQRIDEEVENDKNFAQTREFGSFTEKNKLSYDKCKSPEEKMPLNISPRLNIQTNSNANNMNTTTGLLEHNISLKRDEKKHSEFDLRNSYINPVSHEIIEPEMAFYKDLMKQEVPINEFMKSLILCHGSRVIYEGTEKKYFESYRKEEETVLEFAKCCSYIFERSDKYENPEAYSLMINGNKSNFDILGINEFSYQRKRFSIVVRNSIEASATVYCKGPLESVRGVLELDKDEMEVLDSILKNFKDNGLKCVLYAKKRLDSNTAETFKKDCHNLKFSLMSQTKELEDLAINLEQKMDLIGVVGLKEEIRKEVPDLLKFFDELNIPCWMLSGDNEENVLNCAFSSNLINDKQDPLYIRDENADDLFLTIRNLLSEVKLVIDPYKKNLDEHIKEKVSPTKKRILKRFTTGIGASRFAISLDVKQLLWNKYIVINGASFNILMSDPYLKSHFIFLLAMPKVIIAYNLTPFQKGEFVKIIQNYFENKTVLAIGDGYNDNLMMQMADVSIEIVHLKTNKILDIRNNAGDIQVNSLKHVKELLLFDGKSFYERLDNLVLFLFYKEYILALPLFFFNWYSSFTGSKIFTSLFVLLYQFCFSALNIIIYGILDRPFEEAIMKKYNGLYLDGAHKKLNSVTRFLLRGIAEAVFQSVVIFYFTIYMVNPSVNHEGMGSDVGMLMVIISAACLFIPIFKICFICSTHKVWACWFGFLFAIGLYICFIFANDRKVLENRNFETEYSEVFVRASALMALAFIIWISLIVGYLFNKYIYRRGCPTINEYYQSRNEGSLEKKTLV